MGSNSLKLYL